MIRDILKLVQSVDGTATGINRLYFVMRSVIARQRFLHLTPQGYYSHEESLLLRRLSIIPAVYSELMKTFDRERAFEETKRIFLPILLSEMMNFYRALTLPMTGDMERFMAYRKAFDERGAGKFCERTYILQNNTFCHFIVTRCLYHDFFTHISTPELTRIFCEADRIFSSYAFPNLYFERGDSWENTIACGKKQCDFFIEKKKQ